MTPDEPYVAKIRELEDTIRDLRKEIEDCHTVLDAARVAMPPDWDKLTTKEQTRVMGLVGRITQALIAWNACPLKITQGQI